MEVPLPRAGDFGGGFIELLMTGRDPTPGVRAGRRHIQPSSLPEPSGRTVYLAPEDDPYADPLQPPPEERRPVRRGRIASLPSPSDAYEPAARAIPERYRRQTVSYDGPQKPGTIVVDTANRFLYLVQPGGTAIRYGIGVGREGFSWKGTQTVSMKREWPDWRPPAEMRKRRPDLPTFLPGGPENPLGARALYLGNTLFRIHGTNEPHTIGQAVSSGCIRLLNEDVIDLYNRVSVGARVVVS
ncbi:L,D-transpeptidase [Chelatococcus sp. SYSU_G07232]|uniref:L,D-transpeptidase n=2 Tax=Chelatococcus albus TaxID=3047466 RepID=A0ABT7AEW9_9HYPH|nr:L,D-transpeptidase [Chelatococcus sp. SYSU_G07232]MDJ1157909.1 L,D-transpeptidase [Chelatococcus sp. SYSU_G07232]